MDGFIKSPCGIQYKTTKQIKDDWSKYDKVVAKIHLDRYGVIITDVYGFPIDNEYDLEDIETQLD